MREASFLAPLALLVEGPPRAFTTANWVGAARLALVGTGLAFGLWFRGIEHLPVNAISFRGCRGDEDTSRGPRGRHRGSVASRAWSR